jgi:hypothetical protein
LEGLERLSAQDGARRQKAAEKQPADHDTQPARETAKPSREKLPGGRERAAV